MKIEYPQLKKNKKIVESKKKILGAKKNLKILKTKSKIHLYFRVVHSSIPLLSQKLLTVFFVAKKVFMQRSEAGLVWITVF